MNASLLEVEGLCVDRGRVRVLDRISFQLRAGETVGVVGASGSGKSTLARAILRLLEPAQGRIWWRGRDLLTLTERDLRGVRREMQVVFQDPTTSLDPRMTVLSIVAEPLLVHGLERGRAIEERVVALLHRVELGQEILHRYPHELSGGQAQRVALARALAPSPALLVADEAFSAVDVSLQAQMVRLLCDLRRSSSIACLFISHDLRLAAFLCDRIAVLSEGKMVEIAEPAALVEAPRHHATRALVAAARASEVQVHRR
jgi:ABC-type glutathione transport system ATPase component